MPNINWNYYYNQYEANDNSPNVYLMREVYVSFKQSQYVPVRCCDAVPDNAFMVRV